MVTPAVAKEKPKEVAKEIPGEIKKVVLKTTEPIGLPKRPSAFSISAALEKSEEEPEKITDSKKENLPSQHFSETDLKGEWQKFLQELQQKDIIIFNAIGSFKLQKKDENIVEVTYPSESARAEFEKVRADFFNHFMHKVNNHNISIEYRADLSMKKEIITKRKIFDKFAEINPVLKELDDFFKLDFN
ncbi:hypothetical protein [Chryseobacterium sp. MDT2-18]|uniref:hypothetical protein n=1 Tax=Chryseobacterium sp. MDT2-18 TaxID=1259136 RepID=UPI00278343AA|nr:hypothetical protein [Chryseobacterium sp. MDT2-18]MDQ0475854.1 hypothetical protein [Chryseobacterium sp. MDT2-18]